MGAIFAVACTVGDEIYVKDRLEYEFQRRGFTSVKRVIANETYTDFIDQDTEYVNSDGISTNDIEVHVKTQGIRNAINNRRIQLEFLSRYNGEKADEYKRITRQEISELEKQVKNLRSSSKRIKSVVDGYVLFELDTNAIYLPIEIQAFINQLSRNYQSLHGLVSECPILEHELEGFFKNIKEELVGEVQIKFEEEKTYEEVQEEQKELLVELNEAEHSNEKMIIEEKIENLHLSIVDKINEIIENSSVNINNYISKVKAFIRRRRRYVSIPKSLFNLLYSDDEIAEIQKYLKERDFLKRFEQYTSNIANVLGS